MTERASVFQRFQVAPEATAGSEPTTRGANIKMLSTMFTPGIQLETESYRGSGNKFPVIVAPNREWMEGGIEGPINYNELIYWLASIMQTPTPTQQASTAAYKSTFVIDNDAADTITSYFVQFGDTEAAYEFNYGLVNELGLEFTREAVSMSGNIIGQRVTSGVPIDVTELQTLSITGSPTGGTFTITYSGQTTTDLDYDSTASEIETALEALSNITAVTCTGGPLPDTAVVIEFLGALARTDVAAITTTDSLTGGTTPETVVAETRAGGAPTELTQQVILPTQLQVYLDDTGAGLGTTLLTRLRSVNVSLGNRFLPGWYINSSNNSWVAPVEGPIDFSFDILIQADSVAYGLFTEMRAGDTRFLRVKATGPTIEDSYTYLFQLDMAGKISEVGEWSDEDGVLGLSFTFNGVYDSTWGKSIYAELTNTVTAL